MARQYRPARKAGNTRPIKVKHRFHSIEELEEAIADGLLDDLKRDDEYFAFKYRGNNSKNIWPTDREYYQLVRYLQRYEPLFADDEEAWEHFELYRVPRGTAWKPASREGKKTRSVRKNAQRAPRKPKEVIKKRKETKAQRARRLEEKRLSEQRRRSQRAIEAIVSGERTPTGRLHNKNYGRRRPSMKRKNPGKPKS